tara:strand:- start:18011 stop:18298 length:288 start_codon:yes stop_codon:yes gene_type:complete
MGQTVTECLSAGAESVALINGINTDGASSVYAKGLADQAAINAKVQQNVDHLSTILLYAPVDATDDTPDIVGAASNLKTTHVAAVTTGTDYIADK